MIDTDKYDKFLARHAPSTKKRKYLAEAPRIWLQESFLYEYSVKIDLWDIAMSSLTEVKQAREIVPKLSRLIGVEIPWIQDDYPMLNDIFVGKTIEWNYDDSGEWVLVNHNESRWVTMSYIEAYNVSEYREQVGLKEVKE